MSALAATASSPSHFERKIRQQLAAGLFHITLEDRLEHIAAEGLRPWDEHQQGVRARGWDTPRPGCVYLAHANNRRYKGRQGEASLTIDPDCLDLSLLCPDEDFVSGLWIGRGYSADPACWQGESVCWDDLYAQGLADPHDYDPMKEPPPYSSRGEWAHQHAHLIDTPMMVWASLFSERTVAYRGTIPPEAIGCEWPPRPRQRWAAARRSVKA